jgi:hypothetical protein
MEDSLPDGHRTAHVCHDRHVTDLRLVLAGLRVRVWHRVLVLVECRQDAAYNRLVSLEERLR